MSDLVCNALLSAENVKAFSARGKMYRDVADSLLMSAYGVCPPRLASKELSGRELIHYGRATFRVCLRPEVPDLDFAEEIVWLYEQAARDYQAALRLDPTETKSYVQLSHVLRQHGNPEEADANLHKALAILNKAIQADNSDKESYSERAQILEEIGEVDQAIADLQRVLSPTTGEYGVETVKGKIEKLRKMKGPAQQGITPN